MKFYHAGPGRKVFEKIELFQAQALEDGSVELVIQQEGAVVITLSATDAGRIANHLRYQSNLAKKSTHPDTLMHKKNIPLSVEPLT